jgi:hypothetical protein
MAKWIEFIELNFPERKTKTFDVVNKDNGSYIGQIKWYGGFRQYSFFPQPDCIFEKTCLRDISEFMEKLMEERKLENEKNKAAMMRKGFTC